MAGAGTALSRGRGRGLPTWRRRHALAAASGCYRGATAQVGRHAEGWGAGRASSDRGNARDATSGRVAERQMPCRWREWSQRPVMSRGLPHACVRLPMPFHPMPHFSSGACDDTLAACYCPANTTYGRVPAAPDAPPGGLQEGCRPVGMPVPLLRARSDAACGLRFICWCGLPLGVLMPVALRPPPLQAARRCGWGGPWGSGVSPAVRRMGGPPSGGLWSLSSCGAQRAGATPPCRSSSAPATTVGVGGCCLCSLT